MTPQLTIFGQASDDLRDDLRRWHDLRCTCGKEVGSQRCASCPFATAQPGKRRPSNKALGLS